MCPFSQFPSPTPLPALQSLGPRGLNKWLSKKATKDVRRSAEQAMGLLCTKVSDSIRTRIYSESATLKTPASVWAWLKATYHKKSPAKIFSIFARTVRFRLHKDQDPVPEIKCLWGMFSYLADNGCGVLYTPPHPLADSDRIPFGISDSERIPVGILTIYLRHGQQKKAIRFLQDSCRIPRGIEFL